MTGRGPMSDKRDRQSPSGKRTVGKLLLISYFFPPTAGGGVFRPLAMVKYLSQLGWDITVLTATKPKHYPSDEELRKNVSRETKVVRVPVVWEGSWFRRLLGKLGLGWISKSLLTPDERIFWAEKACNEAKKLYADHKFDIIYATGPPFSVILAGLWLKRMKGIDAKFAAEFRDPWTISPYLSLSNLHQKRFADDTERDIMAKADAVIMVTPGFAKMMAGKYPDDASKIKCVQNGFDEDDFQDLPVRDEWRNESCTIVASGTVFGKNNMDDFVAALEKIKKEDQSTWSKIAVRFQGLPDVRLNRRLLESGLTERCKSRGFVTHAENIRDLVTADLLILPVSPSRNSESHIPSRTYEYLASGARVLAICEDGDLSELVGRFPQVRRVVPGDIDGIVREIKDVVAIWETGVYSYIPDPNELRNLTRKARAKEIDVIFRNLIGQRGKDR